LLSTRFYTDSSHNKKRNIHQDMNAIKDPQKSFSKHKLRTQSDAFKTNLRNEVSERSWRQIYSNHQIKRSKNCTLNNQNQDKLMFSSSEKSLDKLN